jgi:phage-related minor tail protein
MSGSARNVSIRVSAEEVDSARARLEALGDVGDRALRRVETAAQAAANAFAGVARPADAEAVRRRGEDIAAYGVELDRLRGKFDPLFAAQQRHKALLEEIGRAERVGAIDAVTAAGARDKATRGYLDSTAALRGMAPAAQAAANAQVQLARTGELSAYQQRILNMQLSDVFQTLALGMPPMMVFLQQGPQIVDVYGGVGNTLRALTAAVGGPFALAFGVGAVAVGGLAARAASLTGEARTLSVALRAVGRDAEIATADLQSYIRALEQQGVARSDARAIVADLARTPGLAAGDIGRAARLAPDLAAATGTDAAAAGKQLADLFASPADGIRKLDTALNFLTASQAGAIRTMLEHGERTKAVDVAVDALTRRIGGLSRDALSPMGTALRDLSSNWTTFMDSVAQSRPIVALVETLNLAVQGISWAVGSAPAGERTDREIARLEGLLAGTDSYGAPSVAGDARRVIEQQLADARARRMIQGGPVTGGAAAAPEPGGRIGGSPIGEPSPGQLAAQQKQVDLLTQSWRDQQRVLAASIPDRVRVRAEIAAAREAAEKNITGAAREELIRRRVAEAIRGEADARGQEIAAITREGQAALALAQASEQGRAAMLRSKAAAEAHAQAATQTAANERVLTEAILNRGAAQEAASGAEAAVALKEQNEALRRLIDAERQGDRAAFQAAVAERTREATRAMEAQREVATDPAIREALTAQIDLVRRRTEEQAALNAELAQARRLSAGRRELEDLRDQIDLLGESAAVRERELATRRATRQLVQEGADPANLTAAQRALVDQAAALADANTQLRQQRGLYDGIADSAVQAFGRVGDAITQAFVGGQGAAVNWGNVTRGVVSSVLSEIVKLSLVNPLLNAVLGTERPSMFSAGGGLGLSDILSGGSLLARGAEFLGFDIAGSLGLGGGSLSGSIGTALFGATPLGPTLSGAPLAATPGLFGTYGTSLLGGSQLTLSGAFAGIGGGFAAGAMLNTLLGRSPAQQTNGMIGSGLGALGGFLVGGPIGGLIGGLAGGGLGGLFGPGESVQGWGYWLESQDGRLKPIDRRWFNESGAQHFAHADQQVAAINALLEQSGLSVTGARNVGGNKNGPDRSWGGAGSFEEAFADLRFTAANDDGLNAVLAGRSFAGPADLQTMLAVRDTIRGLTATPAEKLADAIAAVNAQFDALTEQARRYGLAETGLAEARSRAIADAQAQANPGAQSLLADLAFGGQSALAPEQRYFAALSLLNDARGRLGSGGDVDSFAATARQVLPVARDFLGTSDRYAGLVADVAGVLSRGGGDTAGLGALLQAQADGGDALRETFARYGERQLDVATATLAEFRRLASAIEALLARRTAA